MLEFVLGFDGPGNFVVYRGKKISFTVDLMREVFRLPQADKWPKFRASWTSAVLKIIFCEEPKSGNPYSSEQFSLEFKHWAIVIRLLSEVLMGKSKPTQLHSRDIYYYWAYLWSTIDISKVEERLEAPESLEKPQEMPDWARLVFESLKREILLLQSHILAGNIHSRG